MRTGDLSFNGQTSFPAMYIDDGTVVGDAVTHTGPGRVGRGADGQPLVGKVLKIEADRVGTVALEGAGFSDLTTVGTIATGYQTLVVDGAGKVKVGAGGTRLLVNIAQAGAANIKL
ncbi:hypothetical protein [Deinococcus soli (ex Cha et al. 2016)]|uniref:hypothetical protein n=1 Tax=Deinococcus soli (ex Cha et al. 2016) TaxID=1309411 RepID=UPI00166DD776|nr:hypothetical protein [Deinococcus soli (ex Cha et al. 2016)]GGB69454.1 hypothetical protein GCM10008019_27040 [Deinococcus soli (ex Cha et al. 2016)]